MSTMIAPEFKELEPLTPICEGERDALALEAVAKSLGVPTRIFAGEPLSSSYARDYETWDRKRAEEVLDRVRQQVIEPMIEGMMHRLQKPKHRIVGQDQRDFWRALAKVSGVKQVPQHNYKVERGVTC